MIKVLNVVGARPNFMKIAPLMEAYRQVPSIRPTLVHTGQHYDQALSELFFNQLGIPKPDINLDVGSGSHATQTAEIMKRFEPVVLDLKPDAVLVVGDVNSTIACGLVAVKLGVRLIHVEAGLRSNDWTMPEEINRILTDRISDLLFCTEQSGVDNLKREGIPADKVFLVGNVMIDALLKHKSAADKSTVLSDMKLRPGQYAVLTLHRPANVDDPAVFTKILDALDAIQRELPIIFPIHPRTRSHLSASVLGRRAQGMKNLRMSEPLGYLDFLKLMSEAKIVLTDSGGIQEETAILKVPCLTLRENTERPCTVEAGSNQVVGRDPEKIIAGYRQIMSRKNLNVKTPPLWDGHAAERIVKILAERISG